MVGIVAPALINDLAVVLHAAGGERGENFFGGTGHAARRINVFDAHQPCAAVMPRIGVAGYGRDQRTEMQRSGGRGGKAAAILRLHR